MTVLSVLFFVSDHGNEGDDETTHSDNEDGLSDNLGYPNPKILSTSAPEMKGAWIQVKKKDRTPKKKVSNLYVRQRNSGL